MKIERAGELVGSGRLTNLQKEKQAANEVIEGEQCGLSITTKDDIKIGDILIFFTSEEKARHI